MEIRLTAYRIMLCLAAWISVLSATTAGEPPGRLLFQSGFESDTSVDAEMKRLLGMDRATGYDWQVYPDWIADARFVYLVRDPRLRDFVESRIITADGPHGTPSRVLEMRSSKDDPRQSSTTRNEFSWFSHAAPHDFREGFVRFWLKLEDLRAFIPEDQEHSWYMIMEWKEPPSNDRWSLEKCRKLGVQPPGSNNYRINIGLEKRAGSGFCWRIMGQQAHPFRKTEWTYENRTVPVPLEQWFLVEAYLRKDRSRGRVYFAVNGKVVLDTDVTCPDHFTGRTEHATNPLPLKFWSPLKMYHGKDYWQVRPTIQWYDDLELWSSFPPGYGQDRHVPLEDDFEGIEADLCDGDLHAGFWFEGAEGGSTATIADGRLDVKAGPRKGATVWLGRKLSGDIQIDVDVRVLDDGRDAHNMNLLLFFRDRSGRPLYASRADRFGGDYRLIHGGTNAQHPLTGIIVTFLANGDPENPRVRLRHVPPFDPIVHEVNGFYHARHEHTYHVRVRRRGNRLQYLLDGRLVFDVADVTAPESGHLGFRTWDTHLWWDNLRITRPAPLDESTS